MAVISAGKKSFASYFNACPLPKAETALRIPARLWELAL